MRRMLLISFLLMLGSAQAADKVELTTRVSGVVENVLVSRGQNVKKDEVLLRLNKEIFKARVDEATAELDGLRADEAEARRELDRAQELYSRTVSSTTELDAAKLRHVRAQSALRVAEARLIVANRSLADTELRAPFAGVVSAVPAAPGVVVTAECQPRTLVVLSRRR
jgi:RND family efflux transporter MFP subunit